MRALLVCAAGLGLVAGCGGSNQEAQPPAVGKVDNPSLKTASLPTAFDLVCDLHFSQQASRKDPPLIADYKKTLRLDLAEMRWCEDRCEETKPIFALTPVAITLVSDADPEIDAYNALTISRETGQYQERDRINETIMEQKGVCRRAAFAGFPPRRF